MPDGARSAVGVAVPEVVTASGADVVAVVEKLADDSDAVELVELVAEVEVLDDVVDTASWARPNGEPTRKETTAILMVKLPMVSRLIRSSLVP